MTVLIILALAAVPCWLLWSHIKQTKIEDAARPKGCLLYTSPSPRDS